MVVHGERCETDHDQGKKKAIGFEPGPTNRTIAANKGKHVRRNGRKH
jgi:hypothetical protein